MTTQTNQTQTQNHIDLTNHPQAAEFKKFTADLLNQQKDFWTKELGFKEVPEIAVSTLENNILTELNKAVKDETEYKKVLQKYENECQKRAKIEEEIKACENSKNNKLKDFETFLIITKFLYIKGSEVLFDANTKYLWYVVDKEKDYHLNDSQNLVNNISLYELKWKLPSKAELVNFAKTANNPFRQGQSWRLFGTHAWMTDNGRIDLDEGCLGVSSSSLGRVICCNNSLANLELEQIYNFFLEQDVLLTTVDRKADFKFIKFTPPTLPPEIPKPEQKDCKVNLPTNINPKDIKAAFKFNDNLRCNLDIIKDDEFTDSTRGIWELYGIDENILHKAKVFARNPEKDIQSGVIGIDFGTSSTVVACDNNGITELLRVGTNDFNATSKASDYENPTVLEFKNYNAMLKAWQSQAKMPFVKWKDINCSHAAQNDWRNAENNTQIVAAIFPTLKQWVLKNGEEAILRMKDRNNTDFEISPIDINDEHLKFNAENKTLNVDNNYPFDPIELYAWFLGLNINRRGQGIFMRYNLSFPVAYPKAAREHIRSAFERGLYRSLPNTLNDETIKNEFCVQVRATEPAAYIVGAYQSLNIEPTDEGCYYGVFDFGGGTIDFDFGIIRNPNEIESEKYELVLEHFGEGDGDRYLGGENLIEHLAYETFKLNESICREKNISFTMPADAKKLVATENLIKTSRNAVTNTLIVASKLRCIFEQGKLLNNQNEEITELNNLPLLNNDGEKVENINFQVDVSALIELLKQRIFGGCKNFLIAMNQAFSSISNEKGFPKKIHILLAGNASRSNIVKDLFGIGGKKGSEFLTPQEKDSLESQSVDIIAVTNFIKRVGEMDIQSEINNKKLRESCNFSEALAAEAVKIFGDNLPTFTVYSPLAPDDNNPYQPTAKTAVAIGLLSLDQGNSIKVINHSLESNSDEAPFDFYVGKLIRNKTFTCILQHKSEYQKWEFLAPVIENSVNNLYYTQSAKALSGEMLKGDPQLRKYKLLRFPEQYDDKKAFIRAISPNKVEICAAESLEEVEKNNHSEIQILEFKNN